MFGTSSILLPTSLNYSHHSRHSMEFHCSLHRHLGLIKWRLRYLQPMVVSGNEFHELSPVRGANSSLHQHLPPVSPNPKAFPCPEHILQADRASSHSHRTSILAHSWCKSNTSAACHRIYLSCAGTCRMLVIPASSGPVSISWAWNLRYLRLAHHRSQQMCPFPAFGSLAVPLPLLL